LTVTQPASTTTPPAKAEASSQYQQQWLWALLPTVPVVLLVLRLWFLSSQNVQTMLLLVQHVSPLGLLSALIVALLWAPPAVILSVRALSLLLVVSDPDPTRRTASWLARRGTRMPAWIVWLAAFSAAATWQLRFLPTLLMLCLMIIGLAVLDRQRGRLAMALASVLLPAVAAAVAYILLAPGIAKATAAGEITTCLLLLLPTGLAILLIGPIPRRTARAFTHTAAMAIVAFIPVLISVVFLRAPILPNVAAEVTADAPDPQPISVVHGQVITVDDRMTTLLRRDGSVLFILNDDLWSKTLCAAGEGVPSSEVDVHGWHVQQTLLEWLTPRPHPADPDPRCQGRPLNPQHPPPPQ
jgi:hypothetical protein